MAFTCSISLPYSTSPSARAGRTRDPALAAHRAHRGFQSRQTGAFNEMMQRRHILLRLPRSDELLTGARVVELACELRRCEETQQEDMASLHHLVKGTVVAGLKAAMRAMAASAGSLVRRRVRLAKSIRQADGTCECHETLLAAEPRVSANAQRDAALLSSRSRSRCRRALQITRPLTLSRQGHLHRYLRAGRGDIVVAHCRQRCESSSAGNHERIAAAVAIEVALKSVDGYSLVYRSECIALLVFAR